MPKRIYSNEQVIKFHQQYRDSQKDISSLIEANGLSISMWSLQKRFKALGLPANPYRKFPVSDDYFHTIDTEEKAYILGFLFADGCNREEANRIDVSLAKQDEDILIKLSQIILKGNNNIHEYKAKKETRQNTTTLSIHSKKLSADLAKHGCMSRKTFIIKFPSLPDHLQRHFIRGYFDGDGMLVIYERLQARRITTCKIAEFSIVSTIEMLNSIGEKANQLGINFKINKRHKDRPNNNFTLRIHGNRQIRKFCDFMYQDATIFLNRKHQKYLELTDITK